MATAIAVFGNKGYASSGLSAGIGGTASANDWLVVVVSTYGTGSAGDPILTDNIGGSTGWVKLVDHFGDSGDGSTDFHATWWAKLCVGGETTVGVAPSTGTPDTAWNGAVLVGPTQPNLYVLDQGEEALVGGRNEFTCTNAPLTNNETYVGLTANGTGPLVSTAMSDPGNTGGAAELLSGAANTVVLFNNNEGANNTGQRPVLFDAASVLLFNYVVVFGITDTTPPAIIEATGRFLLGGTIELEASNVAVIEATGRLVLGGTIEVEAEGGDVAISGTGRLLLGGTARVTAPSPFPVPIRPVEDHLGCGVYQAFAFTRGLREIVTMLPFTSLEYERILDDTSTSTLTIDGVSNPRALARCCAALSELEPAEHELAIYRNGWRVWSGPMTDLSFPAEQCVIQASDLSWWLSQRTIHANINSVQQDLVNIWVTYVQDAMGVENSAGVYPVVLALSGQLADRLVQQTDHQLASDVIGELARSGLDWTVVDRTMQGGPLQPQPPPFPGATPYPTLIDANFRIQPTILVSASQQADCWFVNGPANGAGDLIFGEYGPHFPATDDHIEQPAAPDYAAIEAQYGRIEKVVTESRILDQPGIDFNAQTRYDLLKRAVVSISDGGLLPSTPIPMEKLLPGSIVNVHLSNVCRVIGEPYRIKAIKVAASNDGSETVDVQWQPVGTGETL